MTTTTRKTDTSKAALLRNLDGRMHDLEMERIGKEITAKEYRRVKAIIREQIETIRKLAA